MKQASILLIVVLYCCIPVFAALDARTAWEVNSAATSGNINGGGFAPFNATALANDLADLACTSGTTSAPVCSSASYNFIAGDVGHWLFISSGTGYTANQFCQIASVASNQATLTATTGACNVYGESRWTTNSSAGVGAASPTLGIFAIDRSRSTALVQSTLTAVTTTNVVTAGSLTYNKTWNHNVIQIVGTGSGATVGWYTIVTAVASTSFTLDRTAVTATSVDINLGGAISLGSATASRTDDDFFDLMFGTNTIGGSSVFIKSGSYSIGASMSNLQSGGTQAPVHVSGYSTIRGEVLAESSWPILDFAAFDYVTGSRWAFNQIAIIGSSAVLMTVNTEFTGTNCRVTNYSPTANRIALVLTANAYINRCGFQSYMGYALNSASASGVSIQNSWIHDSLICFGTSSTTGTFTFTNNLWTGCSGASILWGSAQTGRVTLSNNTFFGALDKLGIAMAITTGTTNLTFVNNICSGFDTCMSHADVQSIGVDDYNDYYNNTTDVTNWTKGPNDITTNPAFTNVTQSSGTTATYAGTTITATGLFGSVTNGEWILVKSGTGLTNANSYAKINSHTANTVVLDIDIGSDSASGDWVWHVVHGLNFLPTVILSGNPGVFQGGYTTGYSTIGAVQRNIIPNQVIGQ